MINDKRVVGLVLARKGSKGLPGKNIRNFNGKPLIAWSIESGLKSKYIDDVVTSTDCIEICEISRKYGAKVPFLRPSELANDTASSFSVIMHALDFLAKDNNIYDIVVLIEPTSPLRDSDDIDMALEKMIEYQATSIVSLSEVECQHPNFLFKINHSKIINPFTGKYPNNLRRQDIEKLYFLDGSVYCSDIETLRIKKGFYHAQTAAILVPKWKSIEIDDIYDFVAAEALMKYMKG